MMFMPVGTKLILGGGAAREKQGEMGVMGTFFENTHFRVLGCTSQMINNDDIKMSN